MCVCVLSLHLPSSISIDLSCVLLALSTFNARFRFALTSRASFADKA